MQHPWRHEGTDSVRAGSTGESMSDRDRRLDGFFRQMSLIKESRGCRSVLQFIAVVTITATGLSAVQAQPEQRREVRYETGLESYNHHDYAGAFEIWLHLARQGDADAQASVGYLYAMGQGVRRNDVEAIKWLQRAADQGHAEAKSNLGYMIAMGRGVESDAVQAFRLYAEAAAQGSHIAEQNLSAVAVTIPQSDVMIALAQAKRGRSQAQYLIGANYFYGIGFQKDPGKAVAWFERSAGQGYPPAQFQLGVLYAQGQTVARDPEKASYYMGEAAKRNFEPARQWLDYWQSPKVPRNKY